MLTRGAELQACAAREMLKARVTDAVLKIGNDNCGTQHERLSAFAGLICNPNLGNIVTGSKSTILT